VIMLETVCDNVRHFVIMLETVCDNVRDSL
jgi:hypothetical protein